MLNVESSDIYTDINALAKLKNEAKAKTPESIREVAKQFESVFVGMMLKSMRQAKLADSILDSSQSEFYRDMYDQQLSIHLSGERGMGLAELIVKQLSPDQSVTVAKEQKLADYERRALIKMPDTKSIPGHESGKSVNSSNKINSSIPLHSGNEFVNQLRPYAEKAAKKLGLDANIMIAQAALETGWGKSVIKAENGNSSHNLFNIKADKSWQGQQANASTIEYRDGVVKKEIAGFRAYDSYQESFDDYVNFITTNPRYKTAVRMTENPERYMHELQQAGYATDPRYAEKVIKIYKSSALDNLSTDLLALK